jgi:hypothetical protein
MAKRSGAGTSLKASTVVMWLLTCVCTEGFGEGDSKSENVPSEGPVRRE